MSHKREENRKLWARRRRGRVNQQGRASALAGRYWIAGLVRRALRHNPRINYNLHPKK